MRELIDSQTFSPFFSKFAVGPRKVEISKKFAGRDRKSAFHSRLKRHGGWVHTWQAGNRHKRFTFADAVTRAECSLDRPSFGPRDLARRTRWTLTSAAHPVLSPELIVSPRTLRTRPCQRASVRRASTRTDGHLMMSCGRERRAVANERLHHSGDIRPPLSTQTAASCAQRCPTYHPVHVRFMLCLRFLRRCD